MKIRIAFLFILLMITAVAQSANKAADNPTAATKQMLLPSHGSTLLGIFYLAAATGPHPTAIIFHGFPGFEQNLDIAQALRTYGWNVLAMHYRGSWGVKGDFSFEHCAEDADTEVAFILDPANAQKYRIDPHRVVVIGHSMGGYMAASAIAHNPKVAAAVLISAWNVGEDYAMRRHPGSAAPTIENEAKSLEEDGNLVPLAGTSGEALAREMSEHYKNLDFMNLVPAIAPRPVFVITANDGLRDTDHDLAGALQKNGDTHVSERHWDTDHSYSGQRAELTNAIFGWLKANVPPNP